MKGQCCHQQQRQHRQQRCVRAGATTARSRRRVVSCNAGVRARWCLDARYGCKQEVTALLQEWVATVGRSAGLTPQNVRLSSGAIGVPESRLEMEVAFESVAQWEDFLAAIAFQEHKAWSQRVASMVVDGSPVWQVHRSIPVLPGPPEQPAAAAAPPKQPRQQRQLVMTDQISLDDVAAWEQLKLEGGSSGRSSPQPPATPDSDGEPQERVTLDWKGDPIKFNPGDKLPFKFL